MENKISNHLRMPKPLAPFYKKELTAAHSAFRKKHYKESWRHLERAHILGQAYPYEHSVVHWQMLCFGIKVKNIKEVTGQLPRLILEE